MKYLQSKNKTMVRSATKSAFATKIQTTANFASGLSNVKAFGSNNTAGNTIIVTVHGGYHAGFSITSVADTKLNSYNLAISSIYVHSAGGTDANASAIYYASNIGAGANTVTVTLGVGSDASFITLTEYSGLSNASPLVFVSSGTGNTAASPTTGNMNTSGSGNLIIGAFTDSTSGSPTLTAGSGFTIVQQDLNAAELIAAMENNGEGSSLANGIYVADISRSAGANWGMTGAIFTP